MLAWCFFGFCIFSSECAFAATLSTIYKQIIKSCPTLCHIFRGLRPTRFLHIFAHDNLLIFLRYAFSYFNLNSFFLILFIKKFYSVETKCSVRLCSKFCTLQLTLHWFNKSRVKSTCTESTFVCLIVSITLFRPFWNDQCSKKPRVNKLKVRSKKCIIMNGSIDELIPMSIMNIESNAVY